MPNAAIFSLANGVALLAWVALAVAPHRTWRGLRLAVVGALAALYVALVGTGLLRSGTGDGGFDSLANVMRLFRREDAVLAGWVHYLAFDLFVGTWEAEDAVARRLPRLLLLPCLLLTFLFGPAGWLLYVGVRAAAGPRADAGAPGA